VWVKLKKQQFSSGKVMKMENPPEVDAKREAVPKLW